MDAVAAANNAVTQAVLLYSTLIAPPALFALTPVIAVTGVVDFKTKVGHQRLKPPCWMKNPLTAMQMGCTSCSSHLLQDPKRSDGMRTQVGSLGFLKILTTSILVD